MFKISFNKVIWIGILIMLFACMYNLIYTNNIRNYLNPAMIKYVYFSASVIFLMAVFELFNLRSDGEQHIKKGYILFLIPIIVYGAMKSQPISESMAFNRGTNMYFYKQEVSDSLEHNHVHSEKEKMIISGNKIEINDDNFYESMKEIYNNVEKYSSYTLNLSGYVISTDGNTFVLGRTVVSCCAADAEIIGMKCYYNDGDKIKAGSWVSLEGKVVRDISSKEPFINIEKISTITEPRNTYIYRD
ncbi:TIGR03943 family protein [Clostridium sp. 19966]|uniref:TIGR03943 family putative permease subunit n=1 Tax=Clostridium sp. 19966 TaxID=2768166 RepID=UPI0028DDDA35|nr:TIGR03943 family protein [Clostridium sp. 19966]MDT8717291.1 TIGR03943 family protein [Clostridium sp. 19966]